MDDIKKIIWPNDLSDFSTKAAPAVDRLAARTGAEIHLIHVAPDLSGYGRFWGEPDPKHVEGMHDFARRGARKRLAAFCTQEMTSCPLYQVHVALGNTASEILEAVRRTEADLVALPINRSRPLGETARRIIRESPVPVLTIGIDSEG
jgi:nucleotide-binding universal stress UspA family protein